MDRFKRIAHRGWLRRFLSVATFGYYPLLDGVFYTVQADVECRFLASADSMVRLLSDASVELRSLATGDSAMRLLASGDGAARITTDVVDVGL